MSSRVKSYLVIGCSVVAGVAIGILSTSAWQHQRSISLAETRLQGGLFRHIDGIIEIQDETQRTEVKTALRRAEQSFMRHRKRMADSLALDHQILIDDLKQILRTDQWEEVEIYLERGKKRGMRANGRKRLRHMRRDSSRHRSQNTSLE